MNKKNPSCKVFFDGSCPLCAREINLYSKLDKDDEIEWVDVSQPEPATPVGITRERLLSRIHLLDSEGKLQIGASAFFFIWKKLPGWRWLGNLEKNKLIFFLAQIFYEIFLLVRPLIQIPFKMFDRLFGKK